MSALLILNFHCTHRVGLLSDHYICCLKCFNLLKIVRSVTFFQDDVSHLSTKTPCHQLHLVFFPVQSSLPEIFCGVTNHSSDVLFRSSEQEAIVCKDHVIDPMFFLSFTDPESHSLLLFIPFLLQCFEKQSSKVSLSHPKRSPSLRW